MKLKQYQEKRKEKQEQSPEAISASDAPDG